MRASQPRQAFTEDSWQKASSFWTRRPVSTGLLTLPDRSWPPVVQHWESRRQNGTFWAGGRRTSQTPTSGYSARSSQKLQLLVVSVVRGRDDIGSVLEKESLCKNWNHSWRREECTERPSRSSSPDSTRHRPRYRLLLRPWRPSLCRCRSTPSKKKWCSWARGRV